MSLSCTFDNDTDAGGSTVFWEPSIYIDHINHGYSHCEGCKDSLGEHEWIYAVPNLRYPLAADGWAENIDEYGISYRKGKELLEEFEENEIEITRDINGEIIWPQKYYYWFDGNSAWDDLLNVVIAEDDAEHFVQTTNGAIGILTQSSQWTILCKKCMHVQWALEELEFCNVPLNRHEALAEYREYCEADRKHKKQLREEMRRTRLAGRHHSLIRIKGNGEYYYCYGNGEVITPRTVRSLI